MSLLIEKNMRTSGPKLVPGDVKNVDIKSGVGKVSIKWTDPDDTTYENYTFIKWKGTILVRKKDSAPSNMNDGVVLINSIIKNQYKDTAYEDNNLEDGNYYYRFFVYSEDKVYNDSSNMIYNTNVMNVDPVFGNNSWEQIANASESDNIPSTWKVGDEITIQLSGSFNEPITLQIWDFKHFDKSDGTGKAGICFGMKHLMKNKQQMNSSDTNSGGWNNCNMKKTVMNNIYNSIPVEIRNHIKEVKTYANRGGDSSSSQACTDKVFLPGFKELGWSDNYDGNQVKFPIFTDYDSRIKKLNNGSGSATSWWTRSPAYNSSGSFRVVYTDGGWSYYSAGDSRGVCVCFNI